MPLEIIGSPQFPEWLYQHQISLAFTTYQTGKLFLIGLQPNGRLSIFERTFNRAMGLSASSNTLYMSSLYQVWRFENALEPGQVHQGYDRLYVPQLAYTTGDLDIHDMAGEQGHLIFVNTLFNCLATVSHTHSFIPLWQPPFISQLVPEDRCHLNGLAMENGTPRYVTAVSQSDIADGWRDNRHNGGCVIDVQDSRILLDNLSMPHSPRLYQDKLWLLNSGTGYFGYVDMKAGRFEPVTFCPGYLRGLAFVENFAVVGVSKPRHNKTFSGLSLDGALAQTDTQAVCGLLIIDLQTGDICHSLRLEGSVLEELYDVAILPGVRRPMAVGLKTDEIRRMITIGSLEHLS